MSQHTLDDIVERLDKIEQELSVVTRFVTQRTGVIAVVKWFGIAGILGLTALALRLFGL